MVDVKQIWMAQFVGYLELIAEFFETFWIQRAIELNCDIDISKQVVCQPNVTETALTEMTLEFIMLGYDTSFLECHI